MKKSMLLNWRTTALGIGVILTAIGGGLQAALDGDASTVVDWTHMIAEIQIGLALILARDGTT